MNFALKHWQAVVVRPNSALEKSVAVIQQMLWRDGRSNWPGCRLHIIGGLTGCNVLKNNSQLRKTVAQGDQYLVNKDGLPIKHINILMGHLAMNAQYHCIFLHCFQGLGAVIKIGHAALRIGGGARRIELQGLHDLAVARTLNLICRCMVSEI